MKHYIIAKYNDSVSDREAVTGAVKALFSSEGSIPGVHGCEIHTNCTDRSTRYDLMIVVDMEKSALEAWDASALHHQWKERFGSLLASKVIFDCE